MPKSNSAAVTAVDQSSRSVEKRVFRGRRLYTAVLTLSALLFIGQGALVIDRLGFETDEVFFVSILQNPFQSIYRRSVSHHRIPIMVTSYLGALKSWIYYPLYLLTHNGVWAVRLPWLVFAAIAILFLALALETIDSRKAALFLSILLGTDVVFLATSAFDWGPVVLQHLLFMCALFLAVYWDKARRRWLLFLSGMCLGLALWDKALFLWNAGGLAIATLLFGSKVIWSRFSWRNLRVVFSGLVIGMLPLIAYNLSTKGDTLTQNTKFSIRKVPEDFRYLLAAWDGAPAVNGFFVSRPLQHPSLDAISRLRVFVANRWSVQDNAWRAPASCGLFLLGLLVASRTRRKWMGFFALTAAVGWFQSALTVNAGGSIHHCVLFWPCIYAAIALALTAIHDGIRVGGPWIASLSVALFAVNGLLTINQFHARLVANEPVVAWTRADATLAKALMTQGVSRVLTTDWGISNSLSVRTEGAIKVVEEQFDIRDGRFDRDRFAGCRLPECAVVSHLPVSDIFPSQSAKFDSLLGLSGFQQQRIRTIADDAGVEIFQISEIIPFHSTLP